MTSYFYVANGARVPYSDAMNRQLSAAEANGDETPVVLPNGFEIHWGADTQSGMNQINPTNPAYQCDVIRLR